MEPKKAGLTPSPTVHSSTSTHAALPGNHEEESDDSDDDDDEERVYTLPFKVLGTCHSTSWQKALQEAFGCMYGQNGQISVKLYAEPLLSTLRQQWSSKKAI